MLVFKYFNKFTFACSSKWIVWKQICVKINIYNTQFIFIIPRIIIQILNTLISVILSILSFALSFFQFSTITVHLICLTCFYYLCINVYFICKVFLAVFDITWPELNVCCQDWSCNTKHVQPQCECKDKLRVVYTAGLKADWSDICHAAEQETEISSWIIW